MTFSTHSPLLLPVLTLLSFGLVAASCQSSQNGGGADDDDSAVANDDDTAANDDDAAPDDDDAAPDDDDVGPPPGDDDDSNAEGGGVEGSVTRTAPLSGDGIGELFVTISAPAGTGQPPTIIAEATVPGADLSAAESVVEFVVYGVPPSAEPYFVEIFLDEDESGGATGPSPGDYTTVTTPEVTVATAEMVQTDIVLDALQK